MQFNIYLQDVKDAVKRQLAIIGKHHNTPKGDTLFSATTLSGTEEKVMQQFIVDGAQHVVSALAPVISGYNVGGFIELPRENAQAKQMEIQPYLCFSVNTTRTNNALSDAAQDSITSLLVAYVTQSVLAMTLPELASKYATDVQAQLLATTRLVMTKTPPSSSKKTLADCEGSVEL